MALPLASFLAGSLLTLLIPVGVLIALVVWYYRAATRVPYDPAEQASAVVPDKEGNGDAAATSS
jgi:hypothetical protein